MASLVLNGNTSGSVTISSPAVSGTTTITLPTVSGGNFVVSDSSGNVGIGTSSPAQKLQVSNAGTATIQVSNTASTADAIFKASNTAGDAYIGINATGPYIYTLQALATQFYTSGTERMRIDSSGNVMVNTTTENRTKLNVVGASGVSAGLFRVFANGDNAVAFSNSSGSIVGAINVGASSTAYNTTSDYRLKENVVSMVNALDTISKLKPVTYTWKSDGSNGQGFIAHELQAVVPDCVTGEKDEVDEEGKPVYQGIDTSFLVATLTAAIQEQQTIIETLKADIAELKAKVNV